MSRTRLIPVRVFFACTGDLPAEQDALKTEIDRVNDEIALNEGIMFRFYDWRDVSSSMGLAEDIIRDEYPAEEWDMFIGALWHRFVPPTGVVATETGETYKGDTQHDFELAYKLHSETGRPIIRFYHCRSNPPLDQIDPDQLKSVNAFLAEFEPGGAHPGLLEHYTDVDDFRNRVRRGLIAAIDEFSTGVSPDPGDRVTQSRATQAARLDRHNLGRYFEECSHWPSDEFDWEQLLADLETEDHQLVKDHLVSTGLLDLDAAGGKLLFTDEGALFCCLPAYIPRYRLHVDVQVIDEREESGGASKSYLYGSALDTFFRLGKQLEGLWRPRSGRPGIRGSSGSETPVTDYPQLAIIEALANLIIHRDYLEDDCAYITLREDRVEFLNPGRSERAIPDLWEAILNQERLKPKHGRNRRLIEAFNKARINQLEGGGLMRVYSALEQDNCFKPNGEIGLELRNYDEENRFELVIYRRPPPHEMDAVLARRLWLAKQELGLRMQEEPGS